METLDEVIHQRNLLMQTICDMAEKAGIKDPAVPADGPMVLMLAEDLMQYNDALRRASWQKTRKLKELGYGEEHY